MNNTRRASSSLIANLQNHRIFGFGVGGAELPTQGAAGTNGATAPVATKTTVPGDTTGPADDRVAVFDNFTIPDMPHGEWVSNVIDMGSDSTEDNIRRVEIGGENLTAGTIDGVVEEVVADLVGDTTREMRKILDDPNNKIRVINQSQGTSTLRLTNDIWSSVFDDKGNLDKSKFGDLAKELGLTPQATNHEVIQALIDKIDSVMKSSQKIAQIRADYLKTEQDLNKAGILHVVAAGNEGDILKTIDDKGYHHAADVAESVLSDDLEIMVGASTADGKMAPFTVPSPQVDMAMDGVDVEVVPGLKESGTSFSTPEVSAVIDQMLRINPKLTPDQIKSILIKACDPTTFSSQLDGAGILNPKKAFDLAKAA